MYYRWWSYLVGSYVHLRPARLMCRHRLCSLFLSIGRLGDCYLVASLAALGTLLLPSVEVSISCIRPENSFHCGLAVRRRSVSRSSDFYCFLVGIFDWVLFHLYHDFLFPHFAMCQPPRCDAICLPCVEIFGEPAHLLRFKEVYEIVESTIK